MKTNFLILFSIIFMFLSGCSDQSDDKNIKQTKKVTEVVVAQWGTEKYLIYLPVYIAQEKGFYEKEGINITIDFSGNDDQVFAKVLRGDAHFGIGDPIFTAVSRQRGADGLVIASIVDRVALWGVSKSDKKITNNSDFSHLRIGTFPSPSTTYTLLEDTLKSKDVIGASIVQIPIGNELALLESGAADLVMLLEPGASIAESKGYNIVTSFPKVWGEFAFTGLTSTESVISKNPTLGIKMITALQSAVDFAHNNSEGAIEVAIKLFPNLDKKIIVNAVTRMLADETIPKSVKVKKENWKKSIEVRQKVGDVPESFYCYECLYKTE